MIDLITANFTSDITTTTQITIIISTRNRAQSLIQTLQSIFSIDYPAYNLIVLDQSDEKLSDEVLKNFQSDKRFNYLYSSSRGLGAGHNAAIALAKTELIAITDDDCIIPPNWLEEMVKAFSQDENIGLIFGNVYAGNYDPKTGYIPVFERSVPTLLKNISDRLLDGLGIGACFGIRHSAWLAAEGFDEMLGPGAPLGSLEDRDIAIRLLLKGYYVYHSPSFSVIHHGFRKNTELRKLAFRDWFGFGTSFAKYLKCGNFVITRYMLCQMWFGQAILPFFRSLVFERKVRGVTPIWSFWAGFLIGLLSSVESNTTKFKLSKRKHLVSKITC